VDVAVVDLEGRGTAVPEPYEKDSNFLAYRETVVLDRQHLNKELVERKAFEDPQLRAFSIEAPIVDDWRGPTLR